MDSVASGGLKMKYVYIQLLTCYVYWLQIHTIRINAVIYSSVLYVDC